MYFKSISVFSEGILGLGLDFPFLDEHEWREVAALLGCLNGFMTSIYLYRLTQTLTLTLTFTNLCRTLTLT